jgi:hypothetical protein
VAIPFTHNDVQTLQLNLERWQQLGSACVSPPAGSDDIGRPGLWFYYSKSCTELPGTFAKLQTTPAYLNLGLCFDRVQQVVCANLRESEDDYPEGINLMFYRLVLGEVHGEELARYTHVFWMEPDVVPIKIHWLDALVRESSDGQFWVKGSLYLGDMFDDASIGKDWQWIGHINGNALYRLHNREFAYFLRVVVDLEPPQNGWKPFDVSIWKVLHDFPYFWHVHQRVAKHFVYADFLDHWSFSLTDKDVEYSHANPMTFLIHGNNASAGIVKFQEKVKTLDPSRGDGLVDPSRTTVSVFIRSQATDVEYAVVSVSSVTMNLPGAFEMVVAVPPQDVALFHGRLSEMSTTSGKIKVLPEKPLVKGCGHPMQETYTRSVADTYCQGDYVLQLQADAVLARKVYHKDLFFAGKPVIMYDTYEHLPRTAALWQKGTMDALAASEDTDIVYVQTEEHVYPRQVYAGLRAVIESRHAMPFASFLRTRAGLERCVIHNRGDCARSVEDQISRGFSISAVSGAFLWTYMREEISWTPHDRQEYHRQTFVPIIQKSVCRGDSWLAHQMNKTGEDIESLQSAMVFGGCRRAYAWKRQLNVEQRIA